MLVISQEVSCVQNGGITQFCAGLLSVVSSKWFRQYLHHHHHHHRRHSSRLRRLHTFLDQLPPPATDKTYIPNIYLNDSLSSQYLSSSWQFPNKFHHQHSVCVFRFQHPSYMVKQSYHSVFSIWFTSIKKRRGRDQVNYTGAFYREGLGYNTCWPLRIFPHAKFVCEKKTAARIPYESHRRSTPTLQQSK